jgi:hypothetical protein
MSGGDIEEERYLCYLMVSPDVTDDLCVVVRTVDLGLPVALLIIGRTLSVPTVNFLRDGLSSSATVTEPRPPIVGRIRRMRAPEISAVHGAAATWHGDARLNQESWRRRESLCRMSCQKSL